MLFSVIICTYNRANALLQVLQDLSSQVKTLSSQSQIDSSDFELIVVDNNSTDHTQELLQNFLEEHQALKSRCNFVVETVQGSSAARNRGVKEARGKVLVFLDDDILLDSTWLLEVKKLVEKQDDLVAGIKVIPDWAEPLPDWLRIYPHYEVIQSCFPAHDYGEEAQAYPFVLANSRKVFNPISACFLCSKKYFEEYGDFREDLGIHGSERGACEDTEFFWRLLAAGVQITYQPQIKIVHPIPEQRMGKEHILAWYKLLGKTLEYMAQQNLVHINPQQKPSSKFKLGFKLTVFTLLYFISWFSFNPAMRFWLNCQIAKTQGAMEII